MKLKKWMQVIVVVMSVVILAACSSKHKRAGADDAAVSDANAAYSSGAEASGLGQESQFGDQASRGQLASNNKHVYYFDFNSDAVHADDKPAIDANANRIASRTSSKVMLEGHTDPRGSREYNVGLGERRAKSVAEIMTTKGVAPNQVRVVSYGAEKLAAQGHSDADYQQDRRVVLVYLQN